MLLQNPSVFRPSSSSASRRHHHRHVTSRGYAAVGDCDLFDANCMKEFHILQSFDDRAMQAFIDREQNETKVSRMSSQRLAAKQWRLGKVSQVSDSEKERPTSTRAVVVIMDVQLSTLRREAARSLHAPYSCKSAGTATVPTQLQQRTLGPLLQPQIVSMLCIRF